jgi:uncharacterized lipoprotein YddW (UPF0748 family)
MHKLKFLMLTVLVTLIASFAPTTQAQSIYEALVINGTTVTHYGTTDPVLIPVTYEEKQTDFRGVWVATVYNLNMPTHTSETQYKAAFMNLLDQVEAGNMNAIVFQVRPMNDAFYDSQFAPWSRWLTGSEGTDPGWDVMGWMIQESHSRGIEFHAWLNPYRVANSTMSEAAYLATLDDENFAKQRPDLVVAGNQDGNGRYPYILNPGEPEVKDYIRNVITELVTLYDVDGIHFDDYFYPYGGISSDGGTFNTYGLPGQTIADWRRENVNDVVRGVKEDLDLHNQTNGTTVRFGISPFGIWKNGGSPDGAPISTSTGESYFDQYADSRRWVEEGWLDYINPQIYWNFRHSVAPYADVVDWWADVVRGTGVDLIIGHAPSSAATYGWPADELSNQIRYNQKHPEIIGDMMYSAAFLDTIHMNNVYANNWTTTPLNIWPTSNVDTPEITLDGTYVGPHYSTDVTVSLSGTETLLIRIDGGAWEPYTTPVTFTSEGTYSVHAKQVNAFGEESLVAGIDFTIDKENLDVPSIDVSGTLREGDYLEGAVVTLTSDGTPIQVKINRGSPGTWVDYTGPITLAEAGDYFFIARTITPDGVLSAESSLFVTVVSECYDDPSIAVSGTGNDPYYQNARITLSGASPVIEYRIDGGTWTTYSTPIDFATEGTFTIDYRNQDGCATIFTKTIHIDQTAPTAPEVTIEGIYDGERYYTSATTVTIATDESGVDVWFRLHNGTAWTDWAIFTDPIELEYSGTYTIEYAAVDQADNTSGVQDARIRLDIPPTEDNLYVIRDGQMVTYYGTNVAIELPTSYTEKDAEIRAVWIATVSNIDIGQHTSEALYKAEIIQILNTLEAHNFNTIFFQVRPMNDAFYESEYAPWSRYLTGTEGGDPGWDVFAFLIEEAHQRGIEVHAWLNPYRVSSGTTDKASQLALLHDDNFAKQHPEFVLQDSAGKLILNPGEPQVQAYLRNVIQELMANYDIDGIHFDDYFYSYSGMSDTQDAATYATYGGGMTLADWRRHNIDTIVEDIHDLVTAYNSQNNDHVKFGISPFGIWKSGGTDGSNTSPYALESYHDQYADSKKWVDEGWLDYILPQLYWEFDHSAAPYADLVDWWSDVVAGTGVDLIIGNGFYRYAENTWDDDNELLEQLRYASQYDVVIGHAFFSYKTLNSANAAVVQAVERLNASYWTTYVTFPWESEVEPYEPLVCDDGYHEEDGQCVPDAPVCDDGYHLDGDQCVPDAPVCEDGYHLEGDQCVLDEVPVEEPEDTGCFSTFALSNLLVITLTILSGAWLLLFRRTPS